MPIRRLSYFDRLPHPEYVVAFRAATGYLDAMRSSHGVSPLYYRQTHTQQQEQRSLQVVLATSNNIGRVITVTDWDPQRAVPVDDFRRAENYVAQMSRRIRTAGRATAHAPNIHRAHRLALD